MENITAAPYSNYVQSANALFHFVDKIDFLKSILLDRALKPRFCEEDVGYLNLQVKDSKFSSIAVLEKCFCDIPFHKLMDRFEVQLFDEKSLNATEKLEFARKNTHPDYYGPYAVAFSKEWGENNYLQPVHYVVPNSFVNLNFFKIVFKITRGYQSFG